MFWKIFATRKTVSYQAPHSSLRDTFPHRGRLISKCEHRFLNSVTIYSKTKVFEYAKINLYALHAKHIEPIVILCANI